MVSPVNSVIVYIYFYAYTVEAFCHGYTPQISELFLRTVYMPISAEEAYLFLLIVTFFLRKKKV